MRDRFWWYGFYTLVAHALALVYFRLLLVAPEGWAVWFAESVGVTFFDSLADTWASVQL